MHVHQHLQPVIGCARFAEHLAQVDERQDLPAILHHVLAADALDARVLELFEPASRS